MIFTDLEKADDKKLRNVMRWTFEKKKVLTKHVTFIKNIYINIVTSVKTYDDESNAFSIKIITSRVNTESLYFSH
jgi:hypothetical protein